MHQIIGLLMLASTVGQPREPVVRHLLVYSKEPAAIVLQYAAAVFTEGEHVREGAVGCLMTELKSTGLITDVRVELKPIGDGSWVDIEMTPTWRDGRKRLVISEVEFTGFDGFDVPMLRESLWRAGLHAGVSMWKFALSEIGNMLEEAASRVYASDQDALERIAKAGLAHPSFRVHATDDFNVRLTISLARDYPCGRTR
jgi:hypothetical protein